MAKLPSRYITDKPSYRKLRDMQIGERGAAMTTALVSDKTGECFLIPDDTVYDQPMNRVLPLLIERRPDGFHVTIGKTSDHWLPTEKIPRGAYPVASIKDAMEES